MKALLWLVGLALLLTGCASEKGIIDKEGYQLDTRHRAQAAYPRIKVLVIHYTAENFDVSLATLTGRNVSSHYLIPATPPLYGGKPRIWQLVPEQDQPGMRASVSGEAPRVSMIRLLALSWKIVVGECPAG